MSRRTLLDQTLRIVFAATMGLLLIGQTATAAEPLELETTDTIQVRKFSDDLKVRGFKVDEGVYLGQAKVAGEYGLGVVVERENYAWGINHRGLSITKRF